MCNCTLCMLMETLPMIKIWVFLCLLFWKTLYCFDSLTLSRIAFILVYRHIDVIMYQLFVYVSCFTGINTFLCLIMYSYSSDLWMLIYWECSFSLLTNILLYWSSVLMIPDVPDVVVNRLNCVVLASASYASYIETACMFAKILSTFLFMRQNPVYGILYVIACLCKSHACIECMQCMHAKTLKLKSLCHYLKIWFKYYGLITYRIGFWWVIVQCIVFMQGH